MFEVKDGGTKVLKFEGEQLAASSSRRQGANRWVEFELYRTVGGAYILSRIGRSNFFHRPDCFVVKRNNLSPGEVHEDCVPCDECFPEPSDEVFYVEQPRYWAQVSESPEAVLDALYKYDDAGARYLTFVASRLIEQACKADEQFATSYRVEYVH